MIGPLPSIFLIAVLLTFLDAVVRSDRLRDRRTNYADNDTKASPRNGPEQKRQLE